jgi:hypothetical protein
VRESYPTSDSRSSPAMPELPERPPDRFQFGLRHLFLFMLVSAFVALGLRQLVLLLQQLSPLEKTGLFSSTLVVLTLGGLFYFFFRAPYLAVRAGSIRRRWQEIQQHRRHLELWAQQRRDENQRTAEPNDTPPNTD